MKIKSFLFLLFIFCALSQVVDGQEEVKPDCFRIYLADKQGTPYTVSDPTAFLSSRAIEKRMRFHIQITEEDLPVSPSYLNSVLSISPDLRIIAISKWLNTVTVFCPDPAAVERVIALPFVDSLVGVGTIASLEYLAKQDLPRESLSQKEDSHGSAMVQIGMHNGQYLHEKGYRGEGMLIAVLDAGWDGFNSIPFFSEMYENGQLTGVRDLDPFNNNIYSGHQHGTNVTGVMALNEPGFLIGTAPMASYFFIRSEVNWTEQHFEEDLMVTGFELADSLGADVINASLGYTSFPNYPYQHWTPRQSDGKWSVSSQAASLLADKGIIHVNAAGNSGSDEWGYIGRPADATDILTVAAINEDSTRAAFSSFGYSADGRVKPDVAALGVTVATVSADGFPAFYNGTSLASPIIAGLTACLWQALPHKTPGEIITLIKECCHLYHNPNPELGYGIPNFELALSSQEPLKIHSIRHTNPVTSFLGIENQNLDIKQIAIYDMQGKLIYSQEQSNDTFLMIDTKSWVLGMYIGVATMKDGSQHTFKMSKQ